MEEKINISQYDFNEKVVDILKGKDYGNTWPVVYIINNKNEAYIGETTNAHNRMMQHLSNTDRLRLSIVNIINSKTFNKSVILDLESFLIKHMSADGKFKLQNGNFGLQFHNYYQQEEYEKHFGKIWKELKNKGLVDNSLKDLENSDLYKYSPYKTLTEDQLDVVRMIITNLSMCIQSNKNGTFLINGEPGTGKSILGIYLMKLINDLNNGKLTTEEQDENEELEFSKNLINSFKNLKIGLVIPMNNFRKNIKEIFKNVYGLNPKMVISTTDVPKEKYDILIVDEAHRLKRRVGLAQYKQFDENNRKLGLGNEGTELDWIMKCSKYQILFYDQNQSIRPSDIRPNKIKDLDNDYVFKQTLTSQLRCLGGNDYINYINDIFSDNPPKEKINFCYKDEKDGKYDLKLFNDVDDMVNSIKQKNNELGLCRNFAGDAWPWINKGKKLEQIKKDKTFDIVIGEYKYIWNTQLEGFINSENSINEIGCIHTSQGCDLNYAGIIIGNDLRYDKESGRIFVVKENYYDLLGKAKLESEEELKNYIINIYKILLTRGIRGTYIYVCDKNLREYLKKYIDEQK